MDLILIIGLLWLALLPSYISAGVASVVLEHACEVFQAPGTYVAYQGDRKYLTCSWNDTNSVVTSFVWTLNGNPFTPNSIHSNEERKQRIEISELTDAHSGTYTCTVTTDSDETASASLALELQGRLPDVISTPEVAINGSEVTLTCKHSIINVTRIIWFVDDLSLYGLHRNWVEFSGNSTYSESIKVHLDMDDSDQKSERYRCEVTSVLQCYGGNRKLRKLPVKKLSQPAFELDVKYPIKLELSNPLPDITLNYNSNYNIDCRQIQGDTPSQVTWYKHSDIGELVPLDQVDTVDAIPSTNGQTLRFYKTKSYMAGTYSCEGDNGYGSDEKTIIIRVAESSDTSSISNLFKLSTGVPGIGTQFKIMCLDGYLDNFDKNNVQWFKNGIPLPLQNRYVLEDNILSIKSLARTDEGSYSCKYTDSERPVNFYSENYVLDVVDMPPKPVDVRVLVNKTTENSLVIEWDYQSEGDTVATAVKIEAYFSNGASPETKVENTIECMSECPTQYTLRGLAPGTRYDIQVTSFNHAQQETPSDVIRHTTRISQQFTDSSPDEYVMKLTVGIVAGVFVAVFALGYFLFRRHKKDYKKKVYDKIERELGFTIPKTLLKSDSSKEIEFSSLRFTDTLGEGAFGKVMKAECPGLHCPQGSEVCAVKMCRDENDCDRHELLAEIEVLTRLGVHQHIIPVLGVCTKPGRPTCLITQYVPNGDLQNYLRSCRTSFVGTYPFKPLTNDSFQINVHKMSNLCTSDDSLTSRDLISFARQIACGMEYVSSQKIVHRDLAARNVLVASKRSLKITDFGLAREMKGANEEYVMGPNRKVPYRWLAPESFFEKKFTVHSDVWAYGVLLYEILTLGGSPYPRHTIRDIPEMLKKGYRMSPPTNSKPELNQLMSLCWAEIPESRPSFTETRNLLDELLGDRPEEYLNCGDPEADIVPNLNSNDNKEMEETNFRYSYLSTAQSHCFSLAGQGYDRIADAHSAYNTISPASHPSFKVSSPLMSEIKSNPIPDTYQHLPVIEPSPDADRKNSNQYVNHDTGMSPVIVSTDFTCGTENFVAQKL